MEELLCNVSRLHPRSAMIKQRPVFTLDPEALFSTSEYELKESFEDDLQARLTWAPALADIVTEDEREDDEDARAKAGNWAANHAGLAARIAEVNASAEEKWAIARMALLADLTDELAAVSATVGLSQR